MSKTQQGYCKGCGATLSCQEADLLGDKCTLCKVKELAEVQERLERAVATLELGEMGR